MGKIIKIQNNTGVNPSYSAENIESVISGNMQQQVEYSVLDEYTLPFGTYMEMRNYSEILFDEATRQDESTDPDEPDKIYVILESSEVPTCSDMSNLCNQYSNDSNYKGIVVISTSEVCYNKINVTATKVNNLYRITDINLVNEYSTLEDAIKEIGDNNPVVFEFDDMYSQCARYWKYTNASLQIKTSAFNPPVSDTIEYLPSFVDGYGSYEHESGTGSDAGVEYNIEYWSQFSNTGSATYKFPGGKFYITEDPETTGIIDSDYNIFDLLFRYIYDYLYVENNSAALTNEQLNGSLDGQSANDTNEPTVNNPSDFTFLLKTYKMYKKDMMPGASNNSAKVLTQDEIKELTAEEAQEYFDNTIIHNNSNYKDKLILSETEAFDIMQAKGITSCGKCFLLSDNVGIKSPSSIQYEYYDLGNFELMNTVYSLFGKPTVNNYKYNTNGKVIRLQQIYDPYTSEEFIISQNNSGSFPTGYGIDRYGVKIRGISGKEDIYYFANTDEGKEESEQFKNDILYSLEDGPAVVVTENLLNIDY